MKKTLVIALAAAALIASTAAARTVQDRNWHMCFSMSGSEKLTNLDQLTPAETSSRSRSGSSMAGPKVASIFVCFTNFLVRDKNREINKKAQPQTGGEGRGHHGWRRVPPAACDLSG